MACFAGFINWILSTPQGRLDAELNWVPVSEISQPITIELPVDPSIVPSGERPWLYVFVSIADRRMDDGRWTMDDGGRRSMGARPRSDV
jgi:hypothetical protein